MLIHFAYNPKLINKPIPANKLPDVAHKVIWRRINGQFVNKRGRPETLARLIQQGHAYTSVHRRYRHERNFVKGQVLSLDFDHDGDFNTLIEDSFISQYASFIYSTPSSTPADPRSRVVFVLPQAINSRTLFGAMQTALVRKYKQADRSCKDPVRLFFGSKDCEIKFISNTLPLELIKEMAEEVLVEEVNKPHVVVCPISNNTLKTQLEYQLQKIQTAPSGAKHSTRLKVGTLVGGFVAAGYLDYNEAASYLLSAAMSNTSAPSLAQQDVLDGLNYGLSSPVSIEPQSFEDYGIYL